MRRIIIVLTVILGSLQVYAQVPQGFAYQGVARDAQGAELANTSLAVRVGIRNASGLAWQEDHQVETNDLGLFTLTIGDNSATPTGGSEASFAQIQWDKGPYSLELSLDRGSGFVSMGSAPLMAVPYALYAEKSAGGGAGEPGWNILGDTMYINLSVGIGTDSLGGGLLAIQAKDPQVEKPLFEVRNDDGIPVFAVFNDGVVVYVDESKKGLKGGFAVGGYNTATKGITQEYLRVSPDSVRIWIPEVSPAKGLKGGFAVGGYNALTKELNQDYLRISPDSVQIWIPEDDPVKGLKGGFSVGGYTRNAKAQGQNLLEVTSSSTNIFFDTTATTKGLKGGFAVGGYNSATKATPDQLMSLTRDNYLIGQDAGSSITTGKNNTFFGWKAGLFNTTGDENIFIGKLSGANNLDAEENIFIGNQSGYNTIFGYGNVYIGNQSGFQSTDGHYNSVLGYQAGYNSQSHYNTFLGFQAGYNNTGGKNNIALGFQAGYGLPEEGPGVTGNSNIFMGYGSGASVSSGSNNVFIGTFTGYSNTTGQDNIFLGNNSGYSNSDGNYNMYLGFESGFNSGNGIDNDPSFNTLIGYQAGYSNINGEFLTVLGSRAGVYSTGSYNTFLGAEAGFNADLGTTNTYVGAAAGSSNTGSFNTLLGYAAGFYGAGDGNVLLGVSAGQGSSSGTYFSHNTFVGMNTGYSTLNGNSNTFLGYQAGYLNESGSGNVFIGYEAGYNETGNNKLYISNSDTETPLLYGDFALGSVMMNGNAGINLAGQEGVGLMLGTPFSQENLWSLFAFGDAYFSGIVYNGSDEFLKKNIRPVDDPLEKLKQINAVHFEYSEAAAGVKSGGKESIGVIAQDVEKVFPELVRENREGIKAVNYSGLIPVLIEAIKDQQMTIEQQQVRMDAQQKEIDMLKSALGLN